MLAKLYARLGMYHKAGLMNYLLENGLFQVIRLPTLRPFSALTHVSRSSRAFIQRISSSYLGSPILVKAYRLCASSSGFRRTDYSPTGVVFVCSIISSAENEENMASVSTSTTNPSGWPALQHQLLVSVINKIRKDIEKLNWEHCTSLLR